MSDTLRVLMIEDSPTDAKLVQHAMRSGDRPVTFERVEDAEAMRAALQRAWDVVICDWSMPKFSALAALALLKETGLDLPFIIVSGTVGEELAVSAMRAGASDYVLKGNLSRLRPVVERELGDAEVRAARRKAERELVQQEARFRALIENSWDAITVTAQDGSMVYVSPSISRILGFTATHFIGKSGLDFFHPDDRGLVREKMSQIRNLGAGPLEVEARALHRDGSIRWLHSTATNMLHDPAVAGIVGNIRDVTDQKRSLNAVLQAETRYRRLLESGIFGVVVADLAGNTLEANDAYLRMFGYTRDELNSGLRWTEMTPVESRDLQTSGIEELRQKGETAVVEWELSHKDGHRVPVLLGVAMLNDHECIAVMADLSERKRTEAVLQQTESQLRQSQKMEAVGRLAGGVAHDFNNILSVILSYSQFACDALPPGDPMRDDIEEIRKAGERAADLTKQLLMFSRRQVIEPKVIDLNELLVRMEKMLQRILGEDVTLATVLPRSLGRVKADPNSIEQIIMNLVVNARDAMPTGGKLTIETANVELDEEYGRVHTGTKPGPHVMFAITDTGVGMDKAVQSRIFEPFFTTKEQGKGTGLGLSTVFGIVEQSRGSIWVYSEPGVGTTFKVYFPRTDLDKEAPKSPLELGSMRGTETILLVEDQDQVRAVAHSILSRYGYKVIEARNGGEALLSCEQYQGPIQLLLTDVVMPQMSGPELSQRLAKLRPEMKLLCMSGFTDDSVVRHGVLTSEIAFVQKPFTPEALTRKVREVLDR